MNNERDNTDLERLVSESYREIATERAPAHLNEQILRMAADEAPIPQPRSANAITTAWLRPAAWAATIGLSIAIVLEITQEPIVRPAQIAETGAASAEDTLAGRLEEVQTKIDFEAESTRLDEPPASVAAPPERQIAASKGMAKPLDTPGDVAYVMTDESRNPAKASANEQFKPRERDILREAENQVLLRSGPNLQQEGFALASAVEKKESDEPGACDNESRETAESWYACIQALSESGFTDDADHEHNKFILKFPDFEPKK